MRAIFDEARTLAMEKMQAEVEAQSTKNKKESDDFLAKNKTAEGVKTTDSGLQYQVLQEGKGKTPTASDTVKVHYEGRLVSGKVFDSSRERNEAATFPLNGVIECWTEGLQKMKVGGTAQLVCPPEMTYGEEGRPPQMPGNATLIFDVELLEIVKEEAAPAAP